MCAKEFDMWDEQQNCKIDFNFFYGSKHDGDRIRCNLCCDCFDNLVDNYILPQCEINPIEDNDY